MQFTKEELDTILEKHKKWLGGEEGEKFADLSGEDLSGAFLIRADLRYAILIDTNLNGANLGGADLRDADLNSADLNGANLGGADLRGADLKCADLRGADLKCADLRGADLKYADLRYADLRYAILIDTNLRGANFGGADLERADLNSADLNGANFGGADLSGANLSDVKDLPPVCCPEEGSFIGWKKCVSPSFINGCIVKLLIPADAKRSSATGRKCRCDKALVLGFYDLEGNELSDDLPVFSSYNISFRYRVGETVSVPDFDKNRWNECAPGIHFFITRQEAIDYMS